MLTIFNGSPASLANPNFGHPLVPVLPEADPENDIDRARILGFMLGLQERAAVAPTDWCPLMVDAFYEGLFWGEVEGNAEKAEAYSRHIAMQAAECEDLMRMEAGFHPCW